MGKRECLLRCKALPLGALFGGFCLVIGAWLIHHGLHAVSKVLTAAHVAMQDYVRTIQQLGTTPHEYRTVLLTYLGEGRINEILAAVSVSYGKLYLYGFHDASKLGAALIAQLKVAWGAVVSDPSIELPLAPIDDTYKAWLGAISGAFDKLK